MNIQEAFLKAKVTGEVAKRESHYGAGFIYCETPNTSDKLWHYILDNDWQQPVVAPFLYHRGQLGPQDIEATDWVTLPVAEFSYSGTSEWEFDEDYLNKSEATLSA